MTTTNYYPRKKGEGRWRTEKPKITSAGARVPFLTCAHPTRGSRKDLARRRLCTDSTRAQSNLGFELTRTRSPLAPPPTPKPPSSSPSPRRQRRSPPNPYPIETASPFRLVRRRRRRRRLRLAMGHSARKKKKKKGGGGRKAAKDHGGQLEGDQAALADELTAL